MFWFLVVIASIVAEHYTDNILYKGNQFDTKVDYFLGVERDWIECKDRQLWVEIVDGNVKNAFTITGYVTILGAVKFN